MILQNDSDNTRNREKKLSVLGRHQKLITTLKSRLLLYKFHPIYNQKCDMHSPGQVSLGKHLSCEQDGTDLTEAPGSNGEVCLNIITASDIITVLIRDILNTPSVPVDYRTDCVNCLPLGFEPTNTNVCNSSLTVCSVCNNYIFDQ